MATNKGGFKNTSGVKQENTTVGITRKTYEKLRIYCSVNNRNMKSIAEQILNEWLDARFAALKETKTGQRTL